MISAYTIAGLMVIALALSLRAILPVLPDAFDELADEKLPSTIGGYLQCGECQRHLWSFSSPVSCELCAGNRPSFLSVCIAGLAAFAIVIWKSDQFMFNVIDTALLLGFAGAMIAIGFIDHARTWIPGILTTPILMVGLIHSPLIVEASDVLQGLVTAYFFFVFLPAAYQVVTKREMFGGGDSALMISISVWVGLSGVIWIPILSIVPAIIISRTSMRKEGVFPYGPALVMGTFLFLAAYEYVPHYNW